MSKVYTKVKQIPLVNSIVSDVRYSLLSLLLILAFTFATALAATIRIPLPFTPVPITAQVLVVLLAGAFLGSSRGAASQGLYLLWGLSGLPIFAGGAMGLAAIAGPTGGYLIGFIVAAYVMGRIVKRKDNLPVLWTKFFAASLIILFLGFAHMTIFYIHNPKTAFLMGVLPFVVGDIIKVTVAAGIFSGAQKLLKKRNS
ncbi:MAG: biotin transporter BioY [Candidatus Electryonea clarkiae]|nr:biotin transporter BioY [Candidatus Electryonea clarkiae]MDP8289032.1 biotin transporter BioY [Candidatus Electryonea clarkiae]